MVCFDRRPGDATSAGPDRGKKDRRIRLGYLSGDFRRHVVAHLLPEMLERHDRSRFEVIGYATNHDDGSSIRRRLIQVFDRFIDLHSMDDAKAAATIAADEIDILIDLSGPAPVQVSHLGYPGSMGDGLMDYLLVDPILAPIEHQPNYCERLVHLPDCYQPSDSIGRVMGPAIDRASAGLPIGGMVLCSAAVPVKITPAMFDIWMEVLLHAPTAVLWLLSANSAAANLRREADLMLDTAPYGGGATVNDALWVGLPVLSCCGQTYVGRMAASLLTAVGMPELIAPSLSAYREQALALTADPHRLAAVRHRLAEAKKTSRLFDMARYTGNIESAYSHMWRQWTAGLEPQPFSVPG